jgi:hypothetical protein
MLPESHPLYRAEVMFLLLFDKAPAEQYIEFRMIWDTKHRGEPAPDGKPAHVEFILVKDFQKMFDQVIADWIMRHNRAKYDAFYSVCPRRVVNRTRGGFPVGGKNEDVSHAVCAWMDYDKPTWKAVAEDKPEPTIVVATGHGAHFYYLYPKAVEIEKAVADSEAIARKYGGDATYDPARILRIPGTKNWKEPEKNLMAEWIGGNLESIIESWKDESAKATAGADGAKKNIHDLRSLDWDLHNVLVSGHSSAAGKYLHLKKEGGEVDRSVVDFVVMANLLKHEYSENEIKEIFFDKEFGISAKCLEETQRGNADNYFNRTFDRARLEYQKDSFKNEDISERVEFETWEDLRKAPSLKFCVDRVLPQAGMLLVSGPAKTGKSYLVNDLALLLAGAPGKFLNRLEVRQPGKVLYCQAEIQRGSLDFRLSNIAQSRGVNWRDMKIKFLNQRFDICNTKHMFSLINGIRNEGIEYLIIDPLARFHHEDENKQRDMSNVLSNVERISREGKVLGTILVHHHGKPSSDGPQREGVHQIRGASVIGDWGNAHILLQKRFNKITKAKYVSVGFELRDAEEPEPFDMLFNKSTHLFDEYSEESDSLKTAKNIKAGANTKEEAILALMKELRLSRNEALGLYAEVEHDGKGKLFPDDPTP